MAAYTEVAFMKCVVEAFDSNHVNEPVITGKIRDTSAYVLGNNDP